MCSHAFSAAASLSNIFSLKKKIIDVFFYLGHCSFEVDISYPARLELIYCWIILVNCEKHVHAHVNFGEASPHGTFTFDREYFMSLKLYAKNVQL